MLLAPRAALCCQGSAFQKVVRLAPEKLKTTDDTGVRLLVETLGGVWGKTTLENRFERFERAIYTTAQRTDETHESYMARHEVQFEDLMAQGCTLSDIRAYILLRNSGLSAEDKRRVIVEAEGDLTYTKVTKSLKLLGSKFFQEVQSGSKSGTRSKTYDINYTQEDQESEWNQESDDNAFMVSSGIDDATLEAFQAEGDEDALVIQQFEEQVLEVLQNDAEVASCFNVYLEARKKLTEKAKFRGFWKGSKGKSKGRGKPWTNRRSLEQRIATSRCKICNKLGHWKAECPSREKSNVPNSAFAGMVATSSDDPHDDSEPPSEAFAFVVEDVSGLDHGYPSKTREPRIVEGISFGWKIREPPNNQNQKPPKSNGDSDRLLNRLKHALSDRMPPQIKRSETSKPLSIHNSALERPPIEEEEVHFASSGAVGIVDLGASLSVIGEKQFKNLCQSLPKSVLGKMKEAPCTVNFRFGNSSTVTGRRSIYIPLGHLWMKIVVVPSDTPFLIANSVFRKLGALIDTQQNMIHFRELQCSVPISLSDRRLYMLDLIEVINNIPNSGTCGGKPESHSVCQCSHHHLETEFQTIGQRVPEVKHSEEANTSDDTMIDQSETSGPKTRFDPSSQHPLSGESDPHSHGLLRFGRSLPSCHQARQGADSGGDSGHAVRGTTDVSDGFRQSQTGTTIQGDCEGQPIRDVVHGIVQGQQEALPSPPTSFHPPACGTVGDQCYIATQGQGKECCSSHHIDSGQTDSGGRTGGRIGGPRDVGADSTLSPRRDLQPGDGGDATSHEPSRKCDAAGLESSCQDGESIPGSVNIVQNEIEGLSLEEIALGVDDPCHFDNWVAREMWDYINQTGLDSSYFKKNNHDLMEVYCSQDSQLTQQAIRMGLKATRFTFKDGDLSTAEGRRKLYERLVQYRPASVWCSPRCRAWCRWSTFNMHKSCENARKVIQHREQDIVHLLLCDALFQYQQWRNVNSHAHLEQPVGSQMLHQEEMQRICQSTVRAVCDMCVAGQLRHPDTGQLLKKPTQIYTTSAIMARVIEKLKCDRSHPHDHVAGSFRTSQGHRMNVSQYSELYTRAFAVRLCKAILCSQQTQEAVCTNPEVCCVSESEKRIREEHDTEISKRRRMEDKQPRPLAYQHEEETKWVHELLQEGYTEAPKVGKAIIYSGKIIERLQKRHPNFQIIAVELCKGADRCRAPPVGVSKTQAPWRITYGIHRNQAGNFWDKSWEEWPRLSRKDLLRKTQPSRLLMTVFAQRKSTHTPEDTTMDADNPRVSSPDVPDPFWSSEPEAKRARVGDTVDNQDEKVETSEKAPFKGHGPKFRKLESEMQSMLLKLHKNLGHPDPKLFATVLRDQQWDSSIIDASLDMQCPTCLESQGPKLARPAHLNEPREFNELVIMDGVDWTSQEGRQFHFYHILDVGTNFHIAFVTDNKTSSQVIEHMRSHWLQWAGPPQMLLTDSAGEFCSDEFSRYLQSHDIKTSIVPAESHWQMGRGERHGGILQRMLDKYQIDHPICSDQDLKEALVHCTAAKNSLSRHKGYSPEILVLGKSRHQPSCNTNEACGPSMWIDTSDIDQHDKEQEEFVQNLGKREHARKAFITADHDQKLRRAWLRRSRPTRDGYQPGDWVMYWRQNKTTQKHQWFGPAKVVLTEDRNVTWITHLSRLYRCAPEHLRPVSEREYNDISEDHGQSTAPITLPSQLGTGVFQYHDLANTQGNFPVLQPPGPVEITSDEYPVQGIPTPEAPITPSGDSHIQPDSEPGHQPAPEEIPIPQEPFSEEEDHTGLVTQTHRQTDHWEIQKGWLIRHHCEPRYRLFSPTDIPNCPISSEHLEDKRVTHGSFHQQHPWQTSDRWKATVEAHQSMPLFWTGQTKFKIKNQYLEQESIQETVYFADEPSRTCYEVALTLEMDEVEQCLQKGYADQVSFLASAAKRQKVEVKERELSPAEQELFHQAKSKEIQSWLTTDTVRRIARNQIPADQVLRSRWVLTWKPIDPSSSADSNAMKAKARLVILGFEDPQIDTLARDSPTLGRDSRMLLLQYAASSQWQIRSFDVQTAFLRGSRTDGRILGMEPPPEMRLLMNLKPWECCELKKSAYGLVNAPLLWYEELKGTLISLGFVVSPMDPCLFVLPKSQRECKDPKANKIHGLVGIHVDDGLGAGDQTFHEAIQNLEKKFPFGSKKHQNFVFTGIQITQNADFSIDLDQRKYIEDIPAIQVDRSRRIQPEALVTDTERQALRGLIGSLQYGATNTRPDVAARLSFLQAKITTAQIKDLLEGNRLLQDAKNHKETKIRIQPIPLDNLRFVSFSDASFATRANAQSQKGCLIMAASKEIGEWQASMVSPLMWYSKKIARVVGSTLASESYALSGAIDLLGWMRLHWEWLKYPSDAWRNPNQCLSQSPEAFAIVDCKSLYDLIQKTNIPQCQEYRTTLEALIIRDRIKENVSIKWVHSAAQLADSLTKVMDCTVLRQFLQKGKCIIHDVDEILKQRADKRAKKKWQEQLNDNDTKYVAGDELYPTQMNAKS